tara:strand:- start:6329 stop:7843 length:1515 start_codon:yes stop_codon:yes gene_type:complete
MIENNTSKALCEKWAPILEGVENQYTRETTAVLLENQARHVLAEQSKSGMLEEATTAVGNLGTFQKFAFPLVRRVFPELIANKVVGVQPMQGPVSQVFYLGMDRTIGDGATQNVYGKRNLTYRNATTSALGNVGALDVGTSAGGGSLATSSLNASANTMGGGIAAFPNTATLSQWSTSAGEGLGVSGAGSTGTIPDLSFHIEQQAVIAKTRKFRALWTIEAAQDLKAYHNLDLERELTDLLGKEVALEIDREILEDLRSIAYDHVDNGLFNRSAMDNAGSNSFPNERLDGGTTDYQYGFDARGALDLGGDKNVTFVDFASSALGLAPRHVGEVYSNLVAAVNFAAQDIYKTTFRGAGNYIITSPLVAAMLQSAAKLEGGLDASEAGELGATIQYKGKWLGQYDIYIDPMWPEDELLIGYKGTNAMETGYIYSPYIPIQMLPTVVDPNSFQPRKGLITRYGKTAVAPSSRWYRIIRLVGADSRYLTQPFGTMNRTFADALGQVTG